MTRSQQLLQHQPGNSLIVVEKVRSIRQNARMHDKTFPESDEPVENASQRALKALEYENSAGLGFRRTEWQPGVSNEYDPAAVLEADETPGQLVAAYIAAAGMMAGLVAFAYKPLLFCFLAFLGATVGIAAGGTAGRIGKNAYMVIAAAFFFGMWFALHDARPLV